MKFLFTTIQFEESEFYGRVADSLASRGHESSHVTISPLAARKLARGQPAACIPALMRQVGVGRSLDSEVQRLERTYDVPSLRDVWWLDPACRGRPEEWCLERTVRTFRALERAFDDFQPDILVPELGRETLRAAAHHVALAREIPVLYLFVTIFPNPLIIWVDRYTGQLMPPDAVGPLTDDQRKAVQAWAAAYVARGKPMVSHRVAQVTTGKLRDFARHVAVKTLRERDNEYLQPLQYATNVAIERARALALRGMYEPMGSRRPFVYFPLHVTDDFKIQRMAPHCADQGYLIAQVADALPQGYDLVLKEHPWSIGRISVPWLRRVLRIPNVRLVDPYESSHDLIARSSAVAVISSTVGLEALLHAKPVLTLGEPYYGGYGITVDVDSFSEIRDAVPRVLAFDPDREAILRFLGAAMEATHPGAPQGVDSSPENAVVLAASIERVAREQLNLGDRVVA